MTEPQPFIPYAGAAPAEFRDADHLRVLSILHYVWGGLAMAFSSVFIFHVVFGLLIATGKLNFPAPAAPPGATPAPAPQRPPDAIGYLFAGMGGCAITFGWTVGTLSILAGRRLARHRARTFCLVVACVNCMFMPFGTVLGVFTLVVLGRDSVRGMFEGPRAPGAWQ